MVVVVKGGGSMGVALVAVCDNSDEVVVAAKVEASVVVNNIRWTRFGIKWRLFSFFSTVIYYHTHKQGQTQPSVIYYLKL